MKKLVTNFIALLILLTGVSAFAQSKSIMLNPPKTVQQQPTGLFINPPKYINFSTPGSHANSPLFNSEWVLNTDTVDQSFAYSFMPSPINVTQQDNSIFADTIVGYSERFTSPYNANTFLDSVVVGIGIPAGALTANNNNFRLIISAWSQTVSSSNHLPFPSVLLDSTSISFDDLNALPTDQLNFVAVQMKHKKVGRTFFITVETPYDYSQDITAQNSIALFGDSLDYDQTSTIDTSVQRGLAAGLHYSLYWAGITRGSGSPFYQNFWVSTLVSDQLNGVNDTKLEGNTLAQNYPNPFNPTTQIKYSLENESDVSLKVYNTLGLEVATIVNDKETAGEHQVSFNGDNLPSGTYFYTLKAGTFSQTKRMVLSK